MLTVNDYVNDGGMHCPVCQSKNLHSGEEVGISHGLGTQIVDCKDCQSEWRDDYTLVGYELITNGQIAKLSMDDALCEIADELRNAPKEQILAIYQQIVDNKALLEEDCIIRDA